MSLRTKIRSFTAWVNMRLMSYDQLLNNCLMDLLTGTHMKYLIESMTGTNIKRLESFDGQLLLHIIISLQLNDFKTVLPGHNFSSDWAFVAEAKCMDCVFTGCTQQHTCTNIQGHTNSVCGEGGGGGSGTNESILMKDSISFISNDNNQV